ncbi:YbaK/EbsC family protein [Ectopseudomonas hydrolytica]|uniref:YbaK/EbsC family protein n=1 Tax=Ectopseudomonas hydrolytica TaxID=2493633 RepID=A0ABY5A5B8_9GAMM|nr:MULTISPECIES: YbaK/EbsC family protein [Pseudomonas]MDH0099257.1 YbaK/EbsC family protein [Pseudomonas sp. GD04158]USR39070.1 YbaK/EbsC family protein [Pseudomonas hydrolytica]UTH35763.1 YbaK/EbsC family protein [Pseudomonas sp. KHPS1]
MTPLERLCQRNLDLLQSLNIDHRLVEHEPVLDYPTAHAVRQRFGLRGVESKSLFLRIAAQRYAMLVSLEGARADWTRLKHLLGSRPRVASDAELSEHTGCVPMCACPFGHDPSITLVIDRQVLGCDFLLYSPGPPGLTLEVPGSALPRLLAAQPNAQLEYP